MDILSWLAGFIPNPSTLYRKVRYKGRVRLALGWRGAGIYFFDRPNKSWRTLDVIVTASRDENFVLARGSVEVRASGRREWSHAMPLADALQLPITVPQNLEETYRVDGELLAMHIRQILPSVESVSIRVRIEDYHRVGMVSDPLNMPVSELERTEVRG